MCNRGGRERPHRGALEAGWPKRVLTCDSSSRCGHHTGQALAGRWLPEVLHLVMPRGRRGPERGKGLPGFLGGCQARSRACPRGCLVLLNTQGNQGWVSPFAGPPGWTALLRCWGLGGGSKTRGWQALRAWTLPDPLTIGDLAKPLHLSLWNGSSPLCPYRGDVSWSGMPCWYTGTQGPKHPRTFPTPRPLHMLFPPPGTLCPPLAS